MNILNESLANEPFVGTAINPKFFGAFTTPGTETLITVTPPPIKQTVTVTPDPITQDGVTVTFPPYTQDVTLQPPARQVPVPGTGSVLKNRFESVGIINPSGQIRLCALVRPNVIAAAHHYNNTPYQPYIGMDVIFIGSSGIQVAKITRVAITHGDFECYYLDRVIDTVKPTKIAPIVGDYANKQILAFGLANLTKTVVGQTYMKYAFQQGDTWVGTVSNKQSMPVVVERGDSGSPVFLSVDGESQYLGSMAAINLTQFQVNIAGLHIDEINSL